MTLTGHKTRSVFERYNIVNDGDLRAAVTPLNEAQREGQERGEAQSGTGSRI